MRKIEYEGRIIEIGEDHKEVHSDLNVGPIQSIIETDGIDDAAIARHRAASREDALRNFKRLWKRDPR